MRKYKNGEPVTKEYKDMTEEELFLIDISSFSEEEKEELFGWILKKRDEALAPMQI